MERPELRQQSRLNSVVGRRAFLRLAVLAAGGLVGYEIEARFGAFSRFSKELEHLSVFGQRRSGRYFLVAREGSGNVEIELSKLERDTFLAINRIRVEERLAALELDGTLTRVARIRCADMALRNYFSHKSPIGRDVFDILKEDAGWPNSWQGENLARNNFGYNMTVDTAIHDWVLSEGHRENILSIHYDRVGVGVVYVNPFYIYATVFSGEPVIIQKD